MAKNKGIGLFILFFLCFFSLSSFGSETTRRFLTTGGWYPASSHQLETQIDHYLSHAKLIDLPGPINAIIGPHAGLAYSGPAAGQVYKQIEQLSPKRIILLGVAHRGGFYGACVSSFAYNSTPLGSIPVDRSVTEQLGKEKFFMVNNRVMQYEHSLENHLPFLQQALKGKKYKIVPILFGMLDKKDFKKIAATIKRHIIPHTLVIASTDFTHYGKNFDYTPFKKDIGKNIKKLDMGMIAPILDLDFKKCYDYKMKTRITMCGFSPVCVLLNLFDAKTHKGTLLNYSQSAERTGDFGLSVSYAGIIITGKANSRSKEAKGDHPGGGYLGKADQQILLKMAWQSLVDFFDRTGQSTPGNRGNYPGILKQKNGVFVTLKKREQLRGCIGTIVGMMPLYRGVKENALKAALRDPRFPALKKEELKDIHIEISVMTPLQEIHNYKQIRMGTDGVIIKKGYNQAVFLPQVATETGWSRDTFLGQLCRKAGLPADSYKKPGMNFYIFQAQVFSEKAHGK